MSTTEIVTLVAMLLVSGGAASVLAQWVKRESWGSRPKYIVALALSVAVGLAAAWLAGDVLGLVASWGELTAAQVVAFMGTVYATAVGFYELWFKNFTAKRSVG